MSIYRQPIRLRAGEDYFFPTFPLFQADGVTPLNLTGYAARLSLYVNDGDQRPQVAVTSVSSPSGQVLLGGIQTISFSILQAALASFTDVAGRWKLVVTNTVGSSREVGSGSWVLEPSGP